jgi:type III secretion system (T3SS) inner membrane Yop/YscD-like protein
MDAPILHIDRYNRTESQTPPSGAAVWLEITRGRVRQPLRAVQGPVFLVGAAADCDLVLGDAAFPEVYAYLLVQDWNVTIRRVGDGPELLVNGEPIETSELAAGDRLAFGPFELILQIQITTRTTPPPFMVHSEGNWPWVADQSGSLTR